MPDGTIGEAARQFLEEIQQDFYGKRGTKPYRGEKAEEVAAIVHERVRAARRPDTPQSFADAEDRLLDSLAGTYAPVPPWEDAPTWFVVSDLQEWLEEACARVDWEAAERPLVWPKKGTVVVGTLPLGSVNARTLRVPEADEFVVIVNAGLPYLYWLLAKAILRAIPVSAFEWDQGAVLDGSPEGIRRHLREDPFAFEKFRDALVSYVVYGDARLAEPWILREPWIVAVGPLVESAELFALAHEYAHICAGHLGPPQRAAYLSRALSGPPPDWAQEYDADGGGLIMTYLTLGNSGITDPFSFLGPQFAMVVSQLIAESERILVGDSDGPRGPSHPPADSRGRMISGVAEELLSQESVRSLTPVTEVLQTATRELWTSTKPLLEKLHAKGIRPDGLSTVPGS